MRRIVALSLVGLALTPASASYTLDAPITSISVLPSKEEQAKTQRQRRAFCGAAKKAKGDPERVIPLLHKLPGNPLQYANLLHDGTGGCPKDPNLAIALYDWFLADLGLLNADPEQLGYWRRYLTERGLPADLARVAEIDRHLWVRSNTWSYSWPEPQWTTEDRLAFLNRDQIWAYISRDDVIRSKELDLRIEPWLDQRSARFNPGMAVAETVRLGRPGDQHRAAMILLEGKLLPADPVRAEVLLWEAAPGWNVAMTALLDLIGPRLAGPITPESSGLRLRLRKVARVSGQLDLANGERIAWLLLPDLQNPDQAVQLTNAWSLMRLFDRRVTLVEMPLVTWIEGVLLNADDPRKNDAMSVLTQLLNAGSREAQMLLERDMARHGSLVDAGSYAEDPSLLGLGSNPAHLITTNDYPTRAARERREGTVECWVIMSPYGRVAMVEVAPGTDERLAPMVQATITRRMRWKTSRWPGRYVRVKMPLYQFRIVDADDSPITPPIPGAIVIDSPKVTYSVSSTVIY